MKRALLISSAAVAITAIAAPIAALDIDFSGRSRFTATGGESFIGKSKTSGGNFTGYTVDANGHKRTVTAGGGTGVAFVPSSMGINDADIAFGNDERLHVNVSESTCCFDYGGMLRLEDSGIKSDIYLSGSWGRLDYGNLDNARVGAYDVSVVDAGPLSTGTSVHGGSANGYSFDGTAYSGTGIVYAAPSGLLGGVGLKVGFDGNDWDIGATYSGLELFGASFGVKATTSSSGAYGVLANGGKLFGFDVAGWTGEDDDDDGYYGGGAAYSLGALNLSASHTYMKGVNGAASVKQRDTAIGASYKIADGLKASASILNSDHSAFGEAMKYAARLQLDF